MRFIRLWNSCYPLVWGFIGSCFLAWLCKYVTFVTLCKCVRNILLECCYKVLEKSSNKSEWNLYGPWAFKLLLFLRTDWALWPYVVYGFQVLKKFGDVVWHVSWSVTRNILVVSVGDNKVGMYIFKWCLVDWGNILSWLPLMLCMLSCYSTVVLHNFAPMWNSQTLDAGGEE